MVELNRAEAAVMRSPLRRLSLLHMEVSTLIQWMGSVNLRRILELGCGAGYGAEAILREFPETRLVSTDLDPEMVERARRHVARFPGFALRAQFREEDATALSFPDDSFDGVFEFGILHHVPPWKKALREVSRVLRPGAPFAFEDLTGAAVDAQPWFDHPREARFTAAEFRGAVERAGLEVGRFRTLGRWALFGVARKAPD